MPQKITLLPSAVEDLRWFRRYYVQIFPQGWSKAKAQFEKTFGLLAVSPFMGHPMKTPGLREFSIPRTPFSIIYRVDSKTIDVLRIWDQRADKTDDWLGQP